MKDSLNPGEIISISQMLELYHFDHPKKYITSNSPMVFIGRETKMERELDSRNSTFKGVFMMVGKVLLADQMHYAIMPFNRHFYKIVEQN